MGGGGQPRGSYLSAFTSLFSARYLTYDPNGFPGIFFDIYTGFLVLLLAAGIYTYVRRRPLSRGITPRRHLLRRLSQAAMWFAVTGLVLALFRYLQVLYLDIRILTYLLILGGIAYCGYLTYYLSEHHPLAVERHVQGQLDRRYRVTTKRKQPMAAQPRKPAIQRGKRNR